MLSHIRSYWMKQVNSLQTELSKLLSCLFSYKQHQNMIIFSPISQHWEDAGDPNTSETKSLRRRTSLSSLFPYSIYLFIHYHGCWWPGCAKSNSDSKVHGANMGPIWGCQGPGGPHVGPMNFAIWEGLQQSWYWSRSPRKFSFQSKKS